jgi:hypothetical protein
MLGTGGGADKAAKGGLRRRIPDMFRGKCPFE